MGDIGLHTDITIGAAVLNCYDLHCGDGSGVGNIKCVFLHEDVVMVVECIVEMICDHVFDGASE